MLRIFSIILFLCLANSSYAQHDDLLIDQSFENSNAIPGDWQFQSWQPSISQADIQIDDAANGQQNHILHIKSNALNHAYLSREVVVKPNAIYLFQASIKANGTNADSLAAVIGIHGIGDSSETVRNQENWQVRQVYIKTGDAKTLTLMLGLGHFASNNIGEAWFDDVTLRAVKTIPADAKIIELPRHRGLAVAPANSPWLVATGCALGLFTLLIFFLWRFTLSSKKEPVENIPPTIKQHVDIADGLRGFAILLVMVFHFWQISWWVIPIPFTSGKINLEFIEVSGALGVELFFFLSAFCLSYPYAKSMLENGTLPSIAHYTYRRAIKILPSYWLAMLLILLFLPTMFPTSITRGFWTDIFMHLAFVHNVFVDTHFSINGVFWSLGVEIQFYILFPLLAWIFRRRPIITFIVLSALAVLYRYWIRTFTMPEFTHWNSQLPGFLDLFAAGMLSAYLLVLFRQRTVAKLNVAMTIISILAFVVLLLLFENAYEIRFEPDGFALWQSYHRFYLALVFAALLVASSYSHIFWRKLVANPALKFLSLISYNLYLWHQVVSRVLRDHGWWKASTEVPTDDPYWRWTMFFLSIALSIVVATVITYVIERPLLKYGVKGSIAQMRKLLSNNRVRLKHYDN